MSQTSDSPAAAKDGSPTADGSAATSAQRDTVGTSAQRHVVGTSAQRHVVGTSAEFPVGAHRVVEVAGREIGVFNVGGTLYALPNVCPHQAGPLCEARRLTGTLEVDIERSWRMTWVHDGEIITCPWHGLEYHVPTGRCLAYSHVRLRRFPVTVEGDQVVLELPGRSDVA